MNLSISEIAEMLGATVQGDAGLNTRVQTVSIDTRTLTAGALFVAIAGEQVDGHDWLTAAKAKGATTALVSRVQAIDFPQILVPDTSQALADLARAWIALMPAKRIALTGSNGKTTVKNLISSILQQKGKTLATSGNLNNELGLPLTVLAIRAEHEFAVLEMGAGKPGDIEFLMGIAPAHIALVNNAMAAHLERLTSVHGVAVEKSAVYRGLLPHGVAVINDDDGERATFLQHAQAAQAKIIRFSLVNPEADFYASAVRADKTGSSFNLCSPLGEINVALPLLGNHNIANALAASAVSFAAGANLAQIKAGLEQVAASSGRLQLLPQAQGFSVLNDSYNANPGSVKAGIDALVDLAGEPWLVLGNMAELGTEAEALHRELGAYARAKQVRKLMCIGQHARALASAAGDIAQAYDNIETLTDELRASLHAGVNLLVKGSRSARMERVLQGLGVLVPNTATHAEAH
jgi:UDP-N-acetylmuramoyl-tripeptide--D-alanyl-D-alanine ligase